MRISGSTRVSAIPLFELLIQSLDESDRIRRLKICAEMEKYDNACHIIAGKAIENEKIMYNGGGKQEFGRHAGLFV